MAVNDVDNLETLFSNRHGKKNLQFDPNGRRPRTKRGKTSRNVRPNVICFRTKVGPTKIRAPNSSSAVPSSRIEIFPGKIRRFGRTRPSSAILLRSHLQYRYSLFSLPNSINYTSVNESLERIERGRQPGEYQNRKRNYHKARWWREKNGTSSIHRVPQLPARRGRATSRNTWKSTELQCFVFLVFGVTPRARRHFLTFRGWSIFLWLVGKNSPGIPACGVAAAAPLEYFCWPTFCRVTRRRATLARWNYLRYGGGGGRSKRRCGHFVFLKIALFFANSSVGIDILPVCWL